MHRSVALALTLTLLAATAAGADDKTQCDPAIAGSARVRAVLDGRTIVLADGREVGLAGIELKRADAAKALLEAELTAREVVWAQLKPEPDRYGRAAALLRPAGEPAWLQMRLLDQGLALVASRVGEAACVAAFRRAEQAARAAGLGVWSDPAYVIKKAENPGEVSAQRGRFTLVEGKVLSVRESGAIIYVNFGRRWSEDFTVTVLKKNQRRFLAAGVDLRKMTGRHVRVRGTVEEHNGPWIEATHPEQIEIGGGE